MTKPDFSLLDVKWSDFWSLALGIALFACVVGLGTGAYKWAMGSSCNNPELATNGKKQVLISFLGAVVLGFIPTFLTFFSK